MNSLISETEERIYYQIINHIGCMSEWLEQNTFKTYLNCSAQQANSVLNNLAKNFKVYRLQCSNLKSISGSKAVMQAQK